MQVELTKPEIQQFIADRVNAGDFPSAEAVVEDALARMMEEEVVLDEKDKAAIDLAFEQFERGESMDFDQFAAEARKKFGLK